MQIESYRLARLRVPLKTPFKTSLRTVDQMDDVVIVLETKEGLTGYGSAPATEAITGDSHASIIDAIRERIIPAIVGQDINDINHVAATIQESVAGNTSARAAVEIAVYDLLGQSLGAPLYEVLGGGKPCLETDITISVGEADQMVREAIQAIESGFQKLKVKVGTQVEEDIQRIMAVYEAVGDRAKIGIDANQGWTPVESVSALNVLEGQGIELDFVEQPVNGRDLEGMQYVTRKVTTPVVADESAFSPDEVTRLIEMRGADMINIKLMKSGGISNAIRIADIASRHDMKCMMGCMLETGIGVSAAAHVAVARSASITIVDLDAPLLASSNPLNGGAQFDGAEISLSELPGLGIESVEGLAMIQPEAAATL